MIKLFDKLTKKNEQDQPHLKKSDFPKHVEELDKDSFDEFINTYPLTVIDFWAPWCKPCKTMLPRLRRLERIFQGKVAFGRINTQNEKKIAKKYKIRGLPHFGIFRYGEKIGSATGTQSVGDLKDTINKYLSKYS
ncbi:MAG: thioredoxin family protein [Candidatus Thermoplasmatota archaeon]|nr:thioredoxin family protein [Candidatus Thermoplasmatota archaeon]